MQDPVSVTATPVAPAPEPVASDSVVDALVGADAPDSQKANAAAAAAQFPDEPGTGFPYPYPPDPAVEQAAK